jgi:hypothetical protein
MTDPGGQKHTDPDPQHCFEFKTDVNVLSVGNEQDNLGKQVQNQNPYP